MILKALGDKLLASPTALPLGIYPNGCKQSFRARALVLRSESKFD